MKIVRIENDYGYRVLLQGAFNTGARLVRKLMGDDYVILPFVLDTPIEFRLGDWLVFEEGEEDFGRYELVSKYKPTYDTRTATYRYELKLEAHYMKWKNKKLKYNPQTGGSELSFSLTSSIGTHAAIIIDNLQHLGYTYWDDDSAFVVSFDSSIDLAKAKVVSYDNISILDALTSIAQAFECEWWVTENIIHFGKCQSEGGEEVEFILGDNISDMTKSDSGQEYATQLYIFGSDKNLPRSYKKSDSDDLTKTAIVQRRLMLPTHAELEAVIASDPSYADLPTLLSDHGYSLDDRGFIRILGLRQEQLVEGVYVNDEVYPKTACVVSDIDTYEQDVEEEDNDGNITTTHYTYYRVKDGSGFDFDSDMILEGQTLHIIFTSGSLNGMDFECEFKKSGEDFAPYYEIVGNESYGRFLPDEHLRPRIGDTFALYNWDATKLTETGLIPKASCDLLRKAVEYLDKSKIDPNQYTCTEECYESNYFIRDLGERVRLVNAAYFPEGGRSSRIIGMEVNLDMPYDHPKYTVAEKADYIYQSHVENTEELTFNGQSYTGKSMGGGQTIYLIKLNDRTRPTDSNTFSANRIINDFLSAINDDTANGIIRFLQGLQIGSGDYGIDGSGDAILHAIERLVSLTGQSYTGPDIIGDKGFRLWQDEEGYGHLDIDYLTARMKAYFAELEIRRVTFTQGDLFFSKAGSKIIRVVPVDRDGNELTPTVGTLHLFSSWYALATTDEYTDGELLSQIYAYRCYELSDDGTTATVNLWEVGDMARCQTFNIDEGVHQGVTNRYYSRLVVRKGRKTMDDVDDGLQYNFVDLYVGNSTMPNRSVVDALYDDEGNTISKEHSGYVNNGVRYFVGYDPSIPSGFLQNDLPAVGDDIAQVGSQTYTERQNLIQLALSDGGAIKIYSGVNTYNLADFEKVRIGPNGVVVDAAYFRLRSGADTQSEGMGVAVWRGKWSSMASYAKMDYVEHLGSLWIWMEDTIAQGIYCEPGDNGGWELYVSRGEAGEAPKLCSIVLDSSNVAVVAESDGTVTMENISGLPTTMYVDYGGERVPTSAMSKVVVAGFRIKGDGPQQVGQGICPRNYSINEDDISLSWYLASQRISAKMLFSVTFEADGEEHDVSMYLPVLKTTKAKDGANGANAVDVVLSPAALTIEETSFDGTTRSYDLTNAKAQVRIIDGDTEVIPESISRSVSPSGALSTQYDANEGMIAVTDVNSDTAKSAVVGVTVSYGGNSYTRYLHVYINRMGTWELQAERDVVRSISQKEMTFVDKDGHPITTTQMTEIFQDAARIALTGSLIEFKDVDGQIFMRMAREDGKAVVAGEYFRIENLTARDLNITGQSVFRGFLMREKYTIKREDFVQASGVWYLPDLVHFGSWVEFAEDINYPVSYYELRLPHFPLQQDESVVYIDDQVVEVSNMTDAQWDDYCAYVMQFVGAKMLVENNTISPNAITLDLFTLFQHYGDTSHSQEPFRIWEPLLGLTTLECKCAYINNAYYTGMAVYWEMSTGGIPSKDNRINI